MSAQSEEPSHMRNFANHILVFIILIALAIGLWYLRSALMLIFFSVILAVALSAPVERLKRRGWSHGQSVAITMVGLLFILGLIVLLILPPFIEQVQDLIDELPQAWEDTQNSYNDLARNSSFLPRLQSGGVSDAQLRDVFNQLTGSLQHNLVPFLSGVGGLFTNLLIIVVLTLYLVSEPTIYVEGLLTLAPRDYRPRAYEILRELAKAIRLSIGSQIVAMCIVGTLAYIGLRIIGVENALALAVISGLLNFIPTFGSMIALVIAVIFTIATNSDRIGAVVVWYLVLQQLETNLITPRVVKNALDVPGALTIGMQIIAGALFGFLGVLLAVPLVGVMLVLVRELYVYDTLNSRKASLLPVKLPGGREANVVSSAYYRPPELSPGETASLLASGTDPFEHVQQKQTIEILGPPAEHMTRVTQNQQVVWVALLALVAAQALALIRSILSDTKK